ncbi:GAP family protein [Methanobacterium alcaliphilum]|uniref:GAP family protein n=1 Tax=Methanobacterium alcaliphilum TaxID=392018 RepID=UPI00200AE575|nr:GAP family protein [Methanobacterium alcaliphilum]MCK9151042.1 GAP family protein [Methanobacterium alcaliphilum]
MIRIISYCSVVLILFNKSRKNSSEGVEIVLNSNIIAITIPLAWAAAVSPTALSVFLIMMSMADDRKLAGFSFYAGALSVLLLTFMIGFFMGDALTNTGHSDPATMASIDIFLGAILVLLGIKSGFSNEHKNSSTLEYLKIDENSNKFHKFRRYFTVGLLTFLINFSTAIFVLAAGRQMGVVKAGWGMDIAALLLLIIITLIVVEVPLVLFIVFPKKADYVVKPINKWLFNHTNWVMAAFCLIIGLIIMYNGLNRLRIV